MVKQEKISIAHGNDGNGNKNRVLLLYINIIRRFHMRFPRFLSINILN